MGSIPHRRYLLRRPGAPHVNINIASAKRKVEDIFEADDIDISIHPE
jgi:hypothetical protein